MSYDFQALLALVVIVLATIWGGIWIAQHRNHKIANLYLPLFVSFGAGVLLLLNFTEFLPVAYAVGSQNVSLFVFAGVAFIILMEKYLAPKLDFLEAAGCQHDHHTHPPDQHHHIPAANHQHHLISHQAACSSIGCLLVCAFFDGIQIKSAFGLGSQTGWLVALALLFHILPDGALSAGLALAGGFSKKFAHWSSVVTGLVVLAGGAFSFVLENVVGFQEFVLPFASGILLYVCFVHLLPIAGKTKGGVLAVILGGFFVILVHQFHDHSAHMGHRHYSGEVPKSHSAADPENSKKTADGHADDSSAHPHSHTH